MRNSRGSKFNFGGILAACLVSVIALGCDGDDNTTVINETDLPIAVAADAATITTGNQIQVSATAGGGGDAGISGSLSYEWFAAGGRFTNANAAETGWTAPDETGVFTVSVLISDGVRAGIGSVNITVDQYEPTVEPHYVGAVVCSGCHASDEIAGDQFNPWSQSDHGDALATLDDIGQGENGFCVGCHTVGTYGILADEDLDNGGYDDTAVPRLANVQCENCHGPGSEHPTTNFTSVQVSMDPSICGDCHNGTHHPTFDEWSDSLHAVPIGFAAGRNTCAKCHNGIEAVRYLDDPLNYVAPSANPTEIVGQVCATCHDPHGNDNPSQLRNASVTDVVLPNSVIVEEAGAGRLCMSCHNGRRQDFDVLEQIDEGSGHFGPHHSVQGDMLKGVNAYEELAPGFSFVSSKHLLIGDGCVNCHTAAFDVDTVGGIEHFTGHTFRPHVEACQDCHGNVEEFEDIGAKQDFDGDGVIEGVQDEVRGLADNLREAIIDASTSPEARQALLDDFEGAVGNITISTRKQREAAYNLFFVEFDGSSGVHNANYAIQLLQQSILYIDESGMPAGAQLLVAAD